MIAANYGRIVNLASIAGKEGNPKAPAYSSMKAARDRADEIARQGTRQLQYRGQLRDAGRRQDGMGMSQDPDFLAMIVSKIPRGRMLELEEAASMISWLATAENSFTTGAAFDLSGGRATY